jgi:endonuclease/exonuclease/phosphatase (EEP) superfamily protein YafD
VSRDAAGAPRWRRWLAIASVLPAAGILLSTTAPSWPGQLCSHWTIHGAVALLPAVLVFGRRTIPAITLLLLIALACLPWIAAALEPRAPAADGRGLVVASANVAAWNYWRADAVTRAGRDDPDLLCLVEIRPDDQRRLAGDPRWPHQEWDTRNSGLALLSRVPFLESRTRFEGGYPMIEAQIELGGRRIRIIAVHTDSPTTPSRQRVRGIQLGLIARELQQDDLPALVLGDFNLTVGDPEWQRLRAAGLQRPPGHEPATWPSPLGPFGIGIDHLLTRGLAQDPVRAMWLLGSDHRGLIGRVALPP